MAGTEKDFKVKKGLIVSEGITLGGHTFNDIDIGTEHVDTDDHIMSSGAIKAYVDANAGGSVGGSDTELLYNDGGTENGIASLTWTDTAGSEQLLLSDASDTSLFKIIQTGTGDALEVHDEASDTTVFKVDQSGHVQIGTTSETIGALRVKGYQGTSSVSSVSTYRISRLEDGVTGSLEITSSQSDGDMYVGAGSTGADLILHTRRSSPSVANYENIRLTSNGEIGIEGSNFGSSGQVLTSGGSGAAVSWSTISVVEDTSPQLGGNLDINGNSIVSTSNANINITPNGTGIVDISTALEVGTGTNPLNNGVVTIINDDADTYPKTLLLMDNESDNTNGPVLTLYRNTASPADGDILGKIELNGEDSSGNPRAYGSIRQESPDVSDGSHDGTMFLNVAVNGTQTDVVSIDGTGGIGGLSHVQSGVKTIAKHVNATSTGNNSFITLLEVPYANFVAIKASAHIQDTTNNEVQTVDIMAHYNGSTADFTEYGIIFDGAAAIGEIDVDVNGSNLRIRFKNTQGGTANLGGSIYAVCHPA